MYLIPEVTLYDKIQIKKEYISEEYLTSNFVYPLEEGFASSLKSDDDYWYLGIGCLDRLNVEKVIDKRIDRKLSTPIIFNPTLHPAQQRTLDKFLTDTSGILKAKCGWGKSFLGVRMVCKANDTTLILVHTKLLMEQWKDLFIECTGYEPGIIGDGVFNLKEVTIGLYISVNNRIDQIKDYFGRIIVDEVHRCGAELFADTLNSLPAKHKDGMSATPNRRDGKHVLFKDFFGSKYVEAEEYRDLLIPTVDIKQVPIKFPVLNPTKDWAKALTKVYSDEKYLDIIVSNTKDLLDEGRNCLLLGIRTEALAYLQTKIPRSLVLDGTVKKKEDRANILARVGKDINCLLSTTIFDEGLSCHILDTLILTEPVGKNFAKLEQRIGRIQREHPDKQPICLQVYWLQNKILEGQQKIEYMWYQHNKFYFKK